MEAPKLNDVWVELAQASSLKYVTDAPLALQLWRQSRPEVYDWVYDSAESLTGRLGDEEDQDTVARELTVAIARDCEAYAHMQLWKVHELVCSTVDLLNGVRLAAAAATARSALEAAVALVSADLRQSDVLAGATEASEVPQRLADFSKFMDKSVWGRKGEMRVLESINVLTLKDKLIKKTSDPDTKDHLDQVYSELCDVVHPSASGHQLHWQQTVVSGVGGPVMVPLQYGNPTAWSVAVAELSLWAIGWSTAWTIRAFDQVANRASMWRSA